MKDIDTKEGNFNCMFYVKRQNVATCKALDKAYCRNDLNCSFYKEHDFYKEIPHKTINGKVVRLKNFEENDKIKNL